MRKFLLILIAAIFTTNVFIHAQDNSVNNQPDKSTISNSGESDMEACTLLKIGDEVPDFTITTLEGKMLKLSELRGKTVFLNFFTLSCPMCMKELPLFEKNIWPRYKDNENIVILIIGREETVDKLKTFRDNKKFTFPMASDPKREIYSLFASQYVPRNIVIDKEGKVALTEVGFTEKKSAELFEKIEKQLSN